MKESQIGTYEKNKAAKMKLKKLREQVMVITGASSGIGLVTARMAAKKGARLVLAARNEEALRELTDELREKEGCRAVWVKADVSREEEVAYVAKTALVHFGRFDTWVNNAGVAIFGKGAEVTIRDMRNLFETNFWSAVYGTRVAVRHFKERGEAGAVINVGSAYGDVGVVLQPAYSSSKHALHGWTESIRRELEAEKSPVSVTLIHAGRVDTPLNEHAVSYLKQQPAHGEMIYPPEAVAEAILFSAENRKSDMYVGAQARLGDLIGTISPRAGDVVNSLVMTRTQHAKRPSKPKEDNALYVAGYGLHERGTNVGWVRGRSYYVKAVKHPWITMLAAAGAGVLLWRLANKRSKTTIVKYR